MINRKKWAVVILIMTALFSCTKNNNARKFGGDINFQAQPNEEIMSVTWKESNIWIVSKDTLTGIVYAREKSSMGIMEGRIIIKPSKTK